MTEKKHIGREIAVFVIFGMIYMNVEIASRTARQELLGLTLMSPDPIKPLSLAGWTTLWMFLIAGFGGWICGFLDVYSALGRQKLVFKMMIFGAIAALTELTSGLVLNRWLGLALWDYHHIRWHLLGQVSYRSAAGFTMLSLTVLWFNDFLRYRLWGTERRYSFPGIYRDLFRGK